MVKLQIILNGRLFEYKEILAEDMIRGQERQYLFWDGTWKQISRLPVFEVLLSVEIDCLKCEAIPVHKKEVDWKTADRYIFWQSWYRLSCKAFKVSDN